MDISTADTYMVIKIIFLLFILNLNSWAFASKEEHWLKYSELGQKILKAQMMTPEIEEKEIKFNEEYEALSSLNFKENEADELNEKVSEHLKELTQKKYHTTIETYLNYMSWQNEVNIKSATNSSKIIITNNVYCAGGSLGKANANYHFFIDGCLFYGRANTGSESYKITYEQSDIPTYGFKIAPASGVFVSSQKAEIGFKIPLLYTHQSLTTPRGKSLNKGSDIEALGTIYFRWPFQAWFFQLEYGKLVSKDTTLWTLGAGYSF
jgi:hypothetical protein